MAFCGGERLGMREDREGSGSREQESLGLDSLDQRADAFYAVQGGFGAELALLLVCVLALASTPPAAGSACSGPWGAGKLGS